MAEIPGIQAWFIEWPPDRYRLTEYLNLGHCPTGNLAEATAFLWRRDAEYIQRTQELKETTRIVRRVLRGHAYEELTKQEREAT